MKHPCRIIRHTTCPDPDASGREGDDYKDVLPPVREPYKNNFSHERSE